MKKITSLFCAIILASSFAFANQGGTLTSTPNPIIANQSVTINYDGTGTNFATWTPLCYVHTWLVAKSGETFSQSYGTAWVNIGGDVPYAALDAKLKMTHDGVTNSGKYSITIADLYVYFGVAEVDKAKIGQLGMIVKTQWSNNGASDMTNDMFLSVGVPAVAVDKFNFNFGVDGQPGWTFVDFVKNGTDPNIYEATTTIPVDFSALSCYVGWNNGGFGNATWTNTSGGLSNTVLLSTISNIKSGQVTLTIHKDATSPNWGVSVPLGTGTFNSSAAITNITSLNGVINLTLNGTAQVELYSVTGQLIRSATVENQFIQSVKNGAYLLRVNGETHKVVVR